MEPNHAEPAASSSIDWDNVDWGRVDDATLALLYLGLHEQSRAWKGLDWDAMNRLHEKGFITDPRSRAKSVIFTEEGLVRARQLFSELFVREDRE